MRRLPLARGLAALVSLASCGEEPPRDRVADRLTLVAGDNQQAKVGTTLPLPIRVVAADAQGPLPSVPVGFALSDQTGFVSKATVTTEADGSATVTWSVGGTLGQQRLTATVTGVAPVVARATVSVGDPAVMLPTTAPSQLVVVGRDVPDLPAVKVTDAFGNPVANEAVTFSDQTGGSTLNGTSQATDAAGRASLGAWRIPNLANQFTVRASTPGSVSASFSVFGVPAAVQSLAGNNQAVNAGTQLPLAPAILALDDAGQPLADVKVSFFVESGGGRLLASGVRTTAADGIAVAPGWVLGVAPGPNQLKAVVLGAPDLVFDATGIAATPAQIVATTAAAQAGFFGNFLGQRPEVRVTDGAGQPVAGAAVTFQVTAGGGNVAMANALTDFEGTAVVGGWRLGPTEAAQAMTALVTGLPPIGFSATAGPPPPPAFTIDVRFIGPAPTTTQQAAFTAAAARWQSIILGDVDDIPFDSNVDDLDFCGGQTLTETIDDLIIYATIEPIDGAGRVLGQASPCYLREPGFLTLIGRMRFDAADVANLERDGIFADVVLHEMGHVIGIGSIWDLQFLITGQGGGDPFFTGASARAAFSAATLSPFAGNTVPVENTGGAGTRDAHWRESVLGTEIMTGFVDTSNPLSAITAGALRDQGYVVNDAIADPYTLAAALRRLAGGRPIALVEPPWTGQIRTIDRRGTTRRVFHRATIVR